MLASALWEVVGCVAELVEASPALNSQHGTLPKAPAEVCPPDGSHVFLGGSMKARTFIACFLALCLTALTFAGQSSQDQKKPTAVPRAAATAPSGAQDAEHHDDVVKIGVTLVQIDAIVTDKQGRQVTDLGKDNFEIYEDGKRQLITNFSYFKTESAEAPPVVAAQPAVKGAPTLPRPNTAPPSS